MIQPQDPLLECQSENAGAVSALTNRVYPTQAQV